MYYFVLLTKVVGFCFFEKQRGGEGGIDDRTYRERVECNLRRIQDRFRSLVSKIFVPLVL